MAQHYSRAVPQLEIHIKLVYKTAIGNRSTLQNAWDGIKPVQVYYITFSSIWVMWLYSYALVVGSQSIYPQS